ncbi:MAG: hypothetical protein ACE5JI_10175 [Acidobacteriota bacterium]
MTIALLTLNVLTLAAISVTVFYGTLIPHGGGALGEHLSWGLLTVLLGVFTHTMTFFYFIGVGSSIRRAVEEFGVGAEYWRTSQGLKGRVFAWAGAGMLLLMVTFVLGGGAHTRAFPGWVHSVPGYLALVFSVVALGVEAHYLFRQNRTVNDFNRLLAANQVRSRRETAADAAASSSPSL